MAEPLVQPDSPLAAYLRQSASPPTMSPPDILSLSTLLILIGYHLSPRWALFSLPIIALTLFRLSTSPDSSASPASSRSLQLHIQAAISPEIAKLVNTSQALDPRVSQAIGTVKEIKCVALGLGLSNPMPSVPRLETAAFPFAGPSADASPADNLHAQGVRKVLQRALEQAGTSSRTPPSSVRSISPIRPPRQIPSQHIGGSF
ncbi:hypothetical protein PtA15_11A198 [Puccinia triticina]|uniref:Myosin-binding domain-containing protein n=1 Tax=Puccinia triticina TaxID=208348 RepID=A0ABY7CW56_9BASI|nr:uncharacterized protein PtA15_11A198 [Puccinia triticina]WAQ89509.1 hypothetical protein PtA15_11A198 [Puccinia triticina]